MPAVKWDAILDPKGYIAGARKIEGTNRRLEGSTKGFSDRLGNLASIAGTAAVAGVAALAVGAYKLGASFDAAYDTIRVGTGKTGKALAGLEGDFKAVVKSVPTDFGAAAKAVTELNQRTGATGAGLRQLARQELELSRITKTDLGENIAASTRLFRDWSVPTAKQSGVLDELFRASQHTGIGITRLQQLVVQFGSPLRQLGFSFAQTTALFGEFERAGVVTETVLPGLKRALSGFAKAGEDPPKALAKVIEKIKEAGTTAQANTLAFKIFGQRAGPDMAAAIREGHFDLDNLIKTISGGHDTILRAGKDTQDFAERWMMFKNTIAVAVEPAVSAAFESIDTKMGQLTSFVEKQLLPRLGGLKRAWDDNKTAILNLLNPFDQVNAKGQTAGQTAQSIADSLTTVTKTAGKVAAALTATGHALDIAAATGKVWGQQVRIGLLGFGEAIVVIAGDTAQAVLTIGIGLLEYLKHTLGRFVPGMNILLTASQHALEGMRTTVHNNTAASVRHFEDMRARSSRVLDQLQARVDRVHGKTIDVKARAAVEIADSVRMYLKAASVPGFRATGGIIRGPGGPKQDRAGLFALSNREFVEPAAAVDYYGVDFMEAVRQRKFPKMADGGLIRGLAAGGPVTDLPRFNAKVILATERLGDRFAERLASKVGTGLSKAIAKAVGAGSAAVKAFILGTDRLPYRWGAAGPSAYDCSGLVSAVFGRAFRRGAGGHGERYFTTATFPGGTGFRPGGGGVMQVGVRRPGPHGTGHMVGRYGGLGFEARSTATGIFVGRAASSPGSFPAVYHLAKGGMVAQVGRLSRLPGVDIAGDADALTVLLGRNFRGVKDFDRGGYLAPGATLALNRTGRGEPVGLDEDRLARKIAAELARIIPTSIEVTDLDAGVRRYQGRRGMTVRGLG